MAARHRLQAPGGGSVTLIAGGGLLSGHGAMVVRRVQIAPAEHRALTGEPLRSYRPQRRTLYLVATGSRRAIVSWCGIAAEGAWAWRWKDSINRCFMRRYQPSHSK